MKPIIFLDVDGVLNCELHYQSKSYTGYLDANKKLKKAVKSKQIERMEYYKHKICHTRVQWLNELCTATGAEIVVSSTWRMNKTVEELQEIFDACGATFKVISKTGRCECRIRGVEIYEWLKSNIKPETHGCHYYDFKSYAIIDDDSDMLLWQAAHFFQTDNYAGLNPITCYKIKRFLTGKTFDL